MKKIITPFALLLASFSIHSVYASQNCDSQRENIENQMQYAQRYNNQQQLNGLRQALREVNEHCDTDQNAGYSRSDADIREDLQKQINDKQKEIGKIQVDLAKAQARGKSDKVAKYERKIAQKQKDIEELDHRIDALRSNRKSY